MIVDASALLAYLHQEQGGQQRSSGGFPLSNTAVAMPKRLGRGCKFRSAAGFSINRAHALK